MNAAPDREPEVSNALHAIPPEPTGVEPSTSSAWAASARDPI